MDVLFLLQFLNISIIFSNLFYSATFTYRERSTYMNRTRKMIKLLLFLTILFCGFMTNGEKTEAKKNYTVTPNTKVSGRYAKSGDLNRQTKHYFMLRYYMDQLEKNGGGTLTLKKGTYSICKSAICLYP